MSDNESNKAGTPQGTSKTGGGSAPGMAPGGEPPPAAEQQAAVSGEGLAASLEARIKELETQQGDLTDRLLRAHAEMDNIRKRAEREKTDAAKYAITKFAHDIVGVSDNFQRAVSAVPATASDAEGPLKSVIDGVLMTEREFLKVLERHGVKQIDPQGEPFNPNLHQAVMEQENADVPAGTVIRVFQVGYMIEDRVLRPAMVVVARGGAKPAKPSAEPSAQSDRGDDTSGGAGA